MAKPTLTPEQQKTVTGYMTDTPHAQIRRMSDLGRVESQDMVNSMAGVGKFRDTGRQAENPGESFDSIVGAPARLAIQEAQAGNISWDAVKKIFHQIGADPRTAPTGYDIASQVTDNPYLGTFLASAIDFGAQMPGSMHLTPGVIGEIKHIKNIGNLTDAAEAFAKRAEAPIPTETKIAQLHGQTGEVRDAMPDLIGRAEDDYGWAQRQGKDMTTAHESQGGYHPRSAYDNPRNAPPKVDESSLTKMPEFGATDNKIYHVISDDNPQGAYMTGEAYRAIRTQMSSGDFGAHKAKPLFGSDKVPAGQKVQTLDDLGFSDEQKAAFTSMRNEDAKIAGNWRQIEEQRAAKKPFEPSGKYQPEGNVLKPTNDRMPGKARAEVERAKEEAWQAERAEAKRVRDQEFETIKALRKKGETPRAKKIAQVIESERTFLDDHYRSGEAASDYDYYMWEGKRKLSDLENVTDETQELIDWAKAKGLSDEQILSALKKHSSVETGDMYHPDNHLASMSEGEREIDLGDLFHNADDKDLKGLDLESLSPEEKAFLEWESGVRDSGYVYHNLDDIHYYLVPDLAAAKKSLSRTPKSKRAPQLKPVGKKDSDNYAMTGAAAQMPGAANAAAQNREPQGEPTREQKIAFLRSQNRKPGAEPTREEKIAFLKAQSQGGGEPGVLSKMGTAVLDGVEAVADKLDSYGGAPTRAAIDAGLDGRNPISAFTGQFGEDPALAPTPKEVLVKAGMSDVARPGLTGQQQMEHDKKYNPNIYDQKMRNGEYQDNPGASPADIAAIPFGAAADVTNLLGVGAVRQGIKAGAKGLSKLALNTVKATVPGAAKTSATVAAVADAAASSSAAIKKMFSPVVAKDFKEFKAIAKRHGIDEKLLPESIEFGPESTISRMSRNRAEGVLGEAHMKKFNEALDEVRDATQRSFAKIGGGYAPTPEDAGQIIREGYDEGVDRIFDSVGMTHNKVVEAIPGLSLSPESLAKIESKLSGMERWAKGRAERGFTNAQRGQGLQVLRAIEATRAGKTTYKQTVETLRDIGEVAFKTKNVMADVPPDIAKFRDLYHTVNNALIETVELAAGKPVADDLRASNETITALFGEKSVLSRTLGNKNMADEKVFQNLVANGDSRKIEALKSILPEEAFKKLKGAFLESQIKGKGDFADNRFTFKSLQNNLGSRKHIMRALLDADEISEVGDLLRLGSRFGEPILSTSGTGASSLFRNITEGVRSGIETDTVIDLLKGSARGKETKAIQKMISGGESEARLMLPAGKSAKETSPYAKLAAISPATARTVSTQRDKDEAPKTGPAKWAIDGFAKIQEHTENELDEKTVKSLFKSAQGRKLLIQASDLKPGSKAMTEIVSRLKKDFAGGGK